MEILVSSTTVDEAIISRKHRQSFRSKEQVMSWNVVVRSEENKVHLYCPDCWENAKKLVEEYYENKNSDTK